MEGLFDVQPDGKGGYLITKAEGAQIDHTLKYKARLIATIGGFTETSKDISISVTMGSAKLTAAAMSDVMFAKDRHDEVIFWFDTTDSTLNGVADVEIKDAKYIPMFDITDCGDGIYAITYKDGIVNPTFTQSKKAVTAVTLNLNVKLEGNMSAKANTTAKIKINVVT